MPRQIANCINLVTQLNVHITQFCNQSVFLDWIFFHSKHSAVINIRYGWDCWFLNRIHCAHNNLIGIYSKLTVRREITRFDLMHSIQYNNFMRHGNAMDHSRILSDQLEMLQTCYVINERPHASFRNSPSHSIEIWWYFFFDAQPFFLFLSLHLRMSMQTVEKWRKRRLIFSRAYGLNVLPTFESHSEIALFSLFLSISWCNVVIENKIFFLSFLWHDQWMCVLAHIHFFVMLSIWFVLCEITCATMCMVKYR